jgi:dihydroorotate dehydrogenase electron transfer subunit
MIQTAAVLLERTTSGAAQELRLHAPDLARALVPGQAVLVRGGWGADPYLRRSFTPFAVDAETWTMRLPPSGDWADAWLRTAPTGSVLDCLGPVGNGFALPSNARNLLCLGEADAAWTLLPLALRADTAGLAVAFAMEAALARDLILPARLPTAVEYRAAVPDAPGRGGLASALPELLRWADAVCAAGSLSFYDRLARAVEQARFTVAAGFAQVLYPATFLCGYGACQACVADVAGGRHRVCQRGPIFDLRDLLRGPV